MTGLIRAAMLATMLLALPAGALSSVVPYGNATISENYQPDTFRPGQHGVDYTIITGPIGSHAGSSASSHAGRLPACADPARRGNLRPC